MEQRLKQKKLSLQIFTWPVGPLVQSLVLSKTKEKDLQLALNNFSLVKYWCFLILGSKKEAMEECVAKNYSDHVTLDCGDNGFEI